jgi:hypothetical protein
MFFDIFKSGIVPHNRPNSNYRSSVLATHAEIERSEYNYDWNSDGIRSIEFSEKPPIVTLGCSITLGQGLPIDLIWPEMLAKKINLKVGNISYSGGSITQIISGFFGMIAQYKYNPEYVICNFPPFDRFYFINGKGDQLKDYRAGVKKRKTKDSAPWDYAATIPYEWAYYSNLNALQMLESFCDSNNIKLIWSTWSNALSEDQEDFLMDNFQHYVKDPVRKEFAPHFEFWVDSKTIDALDVFYKMKNWDKVQCHTKEFMMHKEIFNYAYDYHKIGEAPDKEKIITRTPHPGLHKHIHYVNFYYNEMLKNGFKEGTF